MLIASILAHAGLGIVLALFFVIYYVNGNGKAKIFFEILLGLGGNAGAIFVLYRTFKIEDTTVNLFSMASCFFSFIIATIIFVIIFANMIKDKENDKLQIIRLRDIIVGQTSWVKEFRDKRMKEIDDVLDYNKLRQKEETIKRQEQEIETKKRFIDEEIERIEQIGNKKVHLKLPEKSNITLTKEFVDLMPSYFKDVVRCISEMNTLEQEYLSIVNTENMDINNIKSYLYALSTAISSNIFNNNSGDIRIHFRYYDKDKCGYVKLAAIKGNQIFVQDMTFIPYDKENMINKSYECKRALIKSINCSYDYKSDNNAIWKDYLTYTFYNLKTENIPYLSFGISLKNEIRYKKLFYFLNYIAFFEEYLQEKIEILNNKYNLEYIIYGGNE
ncbi:hypothetical protein DWW33_04255 [Roseburia sp. AF15-21]|uniref:hypothetical protein n=1 Tax=Roseburia sp. AF15-21 TaxID=2293128 RepID=UPI000E4A4C03|nr:hypothetical protein [Roseburia sp. AF15-21]RHR89473.1 hypothetical protein DWW33_04255 [Roseburia sp. AF15-21]